LYKKAVRTAAEFPTDISSAHAVINELTLKNYEHTDRIQRLPEQNQELQQQLDWFKRQIFGAKSEKIIRDSSNPEQLWLGGEAPAQSDPKDKTTTIKEHVRKRHGKKILEDDCGESGLRFDSTVPVEVIPCPPEEIKGLKPDEYEVLDTEYTERLCQRSGSYYIKRYVRPVVKLKDASIVTDPAPSGVFNRSFADVTLLSGILVDKFQYFLPLHRQHQRRAQAGVMIARGNLTHWVHRVAALLEPIYSAVMLSVLKSTVLAMDETSLKAGIEKKGKLHRGYVWALYGDKDEVLFLYAPTRARAAVEPYIKEFCGTLITDGYTVYESICKTYEKIIHALCWAHTRREFFEAQEYEPERCGKALDQIGKLYAEEAKIRELELDNYKQQEHRALYERQVVDELFTWLKAEALKGALLPSNRFRKAAAYALEREQGLRVYLSDPAVPIDTNHLERQIRPFPMGRKNWIFCWTEVGAEVVAIIQTLIGCCKLHGVNPFDYFVDVLQKIDTHPNARVAELTPRNWALARAEKNGANQNLALTA